MSKGGSRPESPVEPSMSSYRWSREKQYWSTEVPEIIIFASRLDLSIILEVCVLTVTVQYLYSDRSDFCKSLWSRGDCRNVLQAIIWTSRHKFYSERAIKSIFQSERDLSFSINFKIHFKDSKNLTQGWWFFSFVPLWEYVNELGLKWTVLMGQRGRSRESEWAVQKWTVLSLNERPWAKVDGSGPKPIRDELVSESGS